MIKFKKRLSSALAILLTALTCISSVPVNASEATPKVTFVGVEHSPLVVGDSETFYVSSVGAEKVQYRVFQNKIGTDIWKELTSGYTNAINANEISPINGLDKYEAGKYKLSIWVKKADTEGKLKNKNGSYDSYYTTYLNCVSRDNSNRVYVNGDMNVEKDNYVVGETVKVAGIKDISGMNAPYTYKLHVYDVNNDIWTLDKDAYRNKENLTWVAKKPGTYVLDVWAMSADSTLWAREAKLNGRIYEAWKLKVITVKEKVEPTEINILEKGVIYGSQDAKNPMQINKNVNITANDVQLNNVNVKGNVTITGDNATLNNVKVEGTLVLNPGEKGTVNINNVTADNIEVLSGAANSIHFNNVTAKLLNVNSRNLKESVRIQLKGKTNIGRTYVKSSVILEIAEGSFGNVEVLENQNKIESLIELRGTFDKDITVKTNATLKTAIGAKILKVIIAPANNEKITLDGNFGEVEVNKPAIVATTPNTVIVKITTNSPTTLELAKGSVVNTLDQNGQTVIQTGTGTVGNKINPPVVIIPPYSGGGTTQISVVGVTITPSTSNLAVGESLELTATINPSNATNQNVTWESSNEAVATVMSTTGTKAKVTTISKGNAVITVKTADGQKIATRTITVNVTVDGLVQGISEFVNGQDVLNNYMTFGTYNKALENRTLGITIVNGNAKLGDVLSSIKGVNLLELSPLLNLVLSMKDLNMLVNTSQVAKYLTSKLAAAGYTTKGQLLDLITKTNSELLTLFNSNTNLNEEVDVVIEEKVLETIKINAIEIYNKNNIKKITRTNVRAAFNLGAGESLNDMTLNDFKGTYIITMTGGATFTITVN